MGQWFSAFRCQDEPEMKTEDSRARLYTPSELNVAAEFSIVMLDCDDKGTLCVHIPGLGPFFPIGTNSSFTLANLRGLLNDQVGRYYLPVKFRFGYVKTFKDQTIHVHIPNGQEKLMVISSLFPEPNPVQNLPHGVQLQDAGVSTIKGNIRVMMADFSFASLEEIGRGGQAVVRLFNNRACIKTIPKDNTFVAKNVWQEIKIHKKLAAHDLAPELFAVYEDDSPQVVDLEYGVHLVMERGRCDLHTLLVEEEKLNEFQIASLFVHILDLIKRVHVAGIMIGDVKPENFLLMLPSWDLERANRVNIAGDKWDISRWPCTIEDINIIWKLVVIDFGLSAFADKNSRFSRVRGTPGYCAPEVLCRNYSRNSDNWSAGIMLYSFITGECPFKARTLQTSIGRTFFLDTSELVNRAEFRTLKKEAKTLILGLLEKNPQTRMSLSRAINVSKQWLKRLSTTNYKGPSSNPIRVNSKDSAGPIILVDEPFSSSWDSSESNFHSTYVQPRRCSQLDDEYIPEVPAVRHVNWDLSSTEDSGSGIYRPHVIANESDLKQPPTLDPIKTTKDVFLSYNWGKDGSNCSKVTKINDALKMKGFATWFDSQGDMQGLLDSAMAEGIAASKVVLVFLTSEYIRKCRVPDDNCAKEFRFAMLRHGVLRTIPVVMEKPLLDQKKWTGTVGLNLGNSLYVDATNMTQKFDDFISELSKRISSCSLKIK